MSSGAQGATERTPLRTDAAATKLELTNSCKSESSTGVTLDERDHEAPRPHYSPENIGKRMRVRRRLFARRRIFGDITCLLSVFGWVLAIVNTELCLAGIASSKSVVSLSLKLAITISTMMSLACIVGYFVIETQIYMLENAMDDWRMAVTRFSVLRLLTEVLICAIQPLPLSSLNPGKKHSWPPRVDPEHFPNGAYVCDGEWDAFLTIFMVFRLYVIGRCLKLHNKFFSDVPCQSIGALNRVRVDFFFIFKTYLNEAAGTVFAVIILFQVSWSAWCFRACEAYMTNPLRNYGNAFYLSAITFTTLGYGDLVGQTVCGRSVSILTAFCGVAATALTVAVMSSHLEMTKNEKYFYSFIMSLRRQKEYRMLSANVIKFAWKVFRSRTSKPHAWQHVRYHRKLISTLAKIRALKEQQRPLSDMTMQLQDLQATQDAVSTMLRDIQNKLQTIQSRQSQSTSLVES